MAPFPQVHNAERERACVNVCLRVCGGVGGGDGGAKVEQCDLESGRELATTFSQLSRYELNMRNVNLSMCGHGAFL